MYEAQTYEVILQRMLDRVPDSLDKREGSVIWDTHSPTAIEFQVLYIQLDVIIREMYGDTASREFLIRRCAERGIEPYPASAAVLKGEFTPTTIDVLGKRFNVQELNYVVTEKIADGVYKVQCETAGIVGNQYLGQMTPIEYVAGLETAQLTDVLIPGEDEEDTEDLRKRYFESFNDMAFGGNQKDYQNKVQSINGVGAVKITRVWNSDIHPADMIPNADVQSWYTSALGSLPAAVKTWLTSVYTAALQKKLTVGGTVKLTIINSSYNPASTVLVDTVQATIDPEQNAGDGLGLAPIGHVVHVVSATPVKVNVATKVTFATGYSWDNLSNTIKEQIGVYLLSLRKEWASSDSTVVRIAQIENYIMGITGVIDITGTTINGKEQNLVLDRDDIPILGEVASNG